MHGLKAQNFFPAIGANGPATIHVNFGQAGFVFIEANVKKWGLAPVTGSLAPPPPYGSEQGSILLETGTKDGYTGPPGWQPSQSVSGSPYNTRNTGGDNLTPQHGRSRSGNFRVFPPTSPGPVRSPTDISLAQLAPNDDSGEASSSVHQSQEHHRGNPLHLHLEDATNPPPGYRSPDGSDNGDGRRSSTDSDDAPLIRVVNRSRDGSSATVRPTAQGAHPPQSRPPGYHDAVRQGASRPRSDSSESRSSESAESDSSADS